MSDRVMELRDFLRKGVDGDPDIGLAPANDAMMEAANAIDALTADRDELRAALSRWVKARSAACDDVSPNTFAELAEAESALATLNQKAPTDD